MKKIICFAAIATFLLSFTACNTKTTEGQTNTPSSTETLGGQSAVQDDESQKDVVKVAAGSSDHQPETDQL